MTLADFASTIAAVASCVGAYFVVMQWVNQVIASATVEWRQPMARERDQYDPDDKGEPDLDSPLIAELHLTVTNKTTGALYIERFDVETIGSPPQSFDVKEQIPPGESRTYREDLSTDWSSPDWSRRNLSSAVSISLISRRQSFASLALKKTLKTHMHDVKVAHNVTKTKAVSLESMS
ncbi:hypothetical protein U0C82_03900 [Fulvimarina sp. 2208YS6-2-32]|uniref:Uncharacterized protein n=1 Tax=Fulvimarina uroteuthidis TaxID=3098149 RepID=A0ABU5I0K5_9HYPH|nr:hypothetical protein [Fulvimarina sp. 2208YS6-2-32]MDY8108293.1 hypothetical protein [Fulvimarina sp. 2208YS6-2-32]